MAERISVIIPVYNVEADLPRCLESVLHQTYADLEIVAVDDGSPDRCGEILDRYAAQYANIRVIHQENGGVTSARLRGVAEATGAWIGFVDGDDEIEPDMYERLLANAETYNADISHCGYQMVFSDGRVHYFHNTGALECHDRNTALEELLSGARIEPGLWNKLFRRALFAGLSMPQDIRINEDLLMNYHLFAAAGTSVFEDRCPYHYIVRSGSASRAKLNIHQIRDPIRVKQLIREAAPEALREAADRAYLNTCISVYHTLMLAGGAYREDQNRVRGLLKQEKGKYALLGKKRGLMARMIVKAPLLYGPIYGFYSRYLQKNNYS